MPEDSAKVDMVARGTPDSMFSRFRWRVVRRGFVGSDLAGVAIGTLCHSWSGRLSDGLDEVLRSRPLKIKRLNGVVLRKFVCHSEGRGFDNASQYKQPSCIPIVAA